jgi:hypothetical protein
MPRQHHWPICQPTAERPGGQANAALAALVSTSHQISKLFRQSGPDNVLGRVTLCTEHLLQLLDRCAGPRLRELKSTFQRRMGLMLHIQKRVRPTISSRAK